jgi:transposase
VPRRTALRTWLSGDRQAARDVQIPSIEQEDAKRIERERKYLVEERISIVGRIKGLLALHGIWLTGKRIGKGLRERLDTMTTGDGRPLASFLRRDIERMLRRYDFISRQIDEVIADRKEALASDNGRFPQADKVRRLTMLGAVGETTATVLVAEVYHRSFETRRHVASFVGPAPSPYKSGDTDRDRGISKAGTKLARQTLVELAWFWLRYQPSSRDDIAAVVEVPGQKIFERTAPTVLANQPSPRSIRPRRIKARLFAGGQELRYCINGVALKFAPGAATPT